MPCTRFSALRQGSSRNSTAILISLPPRGILTDLDEHLAGVLAAQQPDERLRRLLQTLHDVLAILQLALAQPPPTIGEELRQPVGVIADEEATDGDAVDEHRREVRRRRRRTRRRSHRAWAGRCRRDPRMPSGRACRGYRARWRSVPPSDRA